MPNPNATLTAGAYPGAPTDPATIWAMLMAQMQADRTQPTISQADRYRYVPRASTTAASRAQEDAMEGITLGPSGTTATDEEKQAALTAYDAAQQQMALLRPQIEAARKSGDAATVWALESQYASAQIAAAAAARVNTDPEWGTAQTWAKLNPDIEEVMASGTSPTQYAIRQAQLAEEAGLTGAGLTGATDETGEVPAFFTGALNDFYAAGRPDLAEAFMEQMAGVEKTTPFDTMGQMLNLQAMQEDITSSRAARQRAAEAAQRAAAQQAFANLMAKAELQHNALQYAQAYGLSPDTQYVPGFEPGGLFAAMAQRGGYEFTPMAPLNLPQPAGLANPAPQWAYQAMNRGM